MQITEVKLQTIKDYVIYLFIKKEIRVETVNAVKKYSKANNKYIDDFDPNKKNIYKYINANNLYR